MADQAVNERNEKEDAASSMSAEVIIGQLESMAKNRVSRKGDIERRWIDDLLQYHGKYDEDTAAKIIETKKSGLFINLTRPKTNAMSARLLDILFPTDDKNWGIQPTPVPLTQATLKTTKLEMEPIDAEIEKIELQTGEDEEFERPEKVEAMGKKDALQAIIDEQNNILEISKIKAEQMELEIDDQLKACRYHMCARDQIEDACKIGTGVLMGPITNEKGKRSWTTDAETGQFTLSYLKENMPAVTWVDPWSYFPDMDARTPEDSEGTFIRHLMKEKGLRQLARLPGFQKDAIRRLLKAKPKETIPQYLTWLRGITGEGTQIISGDYHVWQYVGSLSTDQMAILAQETNDIETLKDMENEPDPLEDYMAVVWFCGGEVLKFSIYPMDSNETLFSVFNLEKDDSSIFGFGIPYIMRDPQKSMNAGWRMMMDNGGISSGPQIVINSTFVDPEDGDWTIKPNKVWKAKDGYSKDTKVFDVYDIQNNQSQLAAIVAMSQSHIDEVTSMPAIAQGEQGTDVTKTAGGMAMLMNSANVVLRRIVKNYDDDVTVPTIRRLYDWNMQFSNREDIKGDFDIDARGSSVLLVREMQSQNLMHIALQFGAHPIYGIMMKHATTLREIFKAHMISPQDHVLSDAEIEKKIKENADNEKQGEDPTKIKELELKMSIANLNAKSEIEKLGIQKDIAMITLAEKLNITTAEASSKMEIAEKDRELKERQFAVEYMDKVSSGVGSGGGSF